MRRTIVFSSISRMATCPRCGAYLHEAHRCLPAWRRLLRVTFAVGRSAIIGAVIGALVLIAIDGHASAIAVAISAIIAVVVDVAVHAQ